MLGFKYKINEKLIRIKSEYENKDDVLKSLAEIDWVILILSLFIRFIKYY